MGGRDESKTCSDYLKIVILKADKKAFNKCVKEGTFISNHAGEKIYSKSEWHQTKVARETSNVVQEGAEVLSQLASNPNPDGGGKQGGHQGGAPVQEPPAPGTRRSPRTQGQ